MFRRRFRTRTFLVAMVATGCGRDFASASHPDAGVSSAAVSTLHSDIDLSGAYAVAVDRHGNVIVGDNSHFRVLRVDTSGHVTTLAGNGTSDFQDGSGGPDGTAEFMSVRGLAVDQNDNVFVADIFGNRVRKIDANGTVTTLAGNGLGASTDTSHYAGGFVDGTGGPNGTAEFYGPCGVAADNAGNVYVVDAHNNRLRKIDASGNVTTVAGNGQSTFADGSGGPTGTAAFSFPCGVAVEPSGKLVVGDDSRVREIDLSGNVTTLAGNGTHGFADGTGGTQGTAEFAYAASVAVDGAGIIYVADIANHRVRRIDSLGNVTTLAGDGTARSMDGSGGPNGTAGVGIPIGIAVDSQGTLYVADTGFGIRVIRP